MPHGIAKMEGSHPAVSRPAVTLPILLPRPICMQPEAANPSLQVLPRTGHSRQSRRHGGVEHDKHNKVPTSDTPSNGESRFDACNSCIT